jgi:hypothetical protein
MLLGSFCHLKSKSAIPKKGFMFWFLTAGFHQFILVCSKKEMEMKQSFNDWLEKMEAGNKIVSTPTPVPSTIEKGLSGTTTAEIIQRIMEKKQEQYNNLDNPSNLWQSIGENNFYRNMKSKGGLLAKQYD